MFYSSRIHWPKLNSNQNQKVAISSKRGPSPRPPLSGSGNCKGILKSQRECGHPRFCFICVFIFPSLATYAQPLSINTVMAAKTSPVSWVGIPRVWTESPFSFHVLLPLDPKHSCSLGSTGGSREN